MNDLKADTKLAIELEKKGYEFYTQAANKVQNPLAKSTLESLAQRELVHLEKVKEFYKNLTGEQKLPEGWLKDVEIPPTKGQLLKPILLKLKDSLDKKIETREDINKAYKIAEQLERDSYALYDSIAKESPDDTTKKFYAALATEENEHFEILDETLQYLNNPGDWFKKEERWIVEG
ncbi:MAG: ferritin family protein [Candidatus Margulisbacteria bacterium]|nr:ferritin family protein [Candidatus Margulisiibacteriota bacterium]